MKGKSLTLTGPDLAIGDKARDFTVLSGDPGDVTLSDFSDLREIRLEDFPGKVKVIRYAGLRPAAPEIQCGDGKSGVEGKLDDRKMRRQVWQEGKEKRQAPFGNLPFQFRAGA